MEYEVNFVRLPIFGQFKKFGKKIYISRTNQNMLTYVLLYIKAIPVVEFSREEYKIKKVFG